MSADKRDLILDGKTAAGVRVRVERQPVSSPYEQPYRVEVDGEPTHLQRRPEVYRDGGTLRLETVRGVIVVPSRLKGGQPMLNGEVIR